MKKSIAALMSLTVACTMFTPAFAAETESPALLSQTPAVISEAPEEAAGRYTFEINGKDVPLDAVIIVPLRAVAEPLGFTATWNGDGTVTVDSGEMHMTITIGEDSYQAITSIEGAVGATAPPEPGRSALCGGRHHLRSPGNVQCAFGQQCRYSGEWKNCDRYRDRGR